MGAEALEVWARHRDAIAVLISDIVMPGGLSGLDLATRLRAEQPSLQIILASGYSQELAQSEGSLPTGLTYLAKPFRPSELARAVRACLDRGHA